VNWGTAALEADIALDDLKSDIRNAEWDMEHYKDIGSGGPSASDPPHMHTKFSYGQLLLRHGPAMVDMLTRWKTHASSFAPEAPIDNGQRTRVFQKRQALAQQIDGNYRAKPSLMGNVRAVWDRIRALNNGFKNAEDFANIAPHFSHFIAHHIGRWRCHRLFGMEPPFPNNDERLGGLDCVISINSDSLLGSQTDEHFYGFSIWCPSLDIAQGNFNTGRLVLHCAV
jgi:hypothetical protein